VAFPEQHSVGTSQYDRRNDFDVGWFLELSYTKILELPVMFSDPNANCRIIKAAIERICLQAAWVRPIHVTYSATNFSRRKAYQHHQLELAGVRIRCTASIQEPFLSV
jgi:hypothetical protein